MHFFRQMISVAIVCALGVPLQAQQVFVHSRPFKGLVHQEADKTWVELAVVMSQLEVALEQTADGNWVVKSASPASEASECPGGQGPKLLLGGGSWLPIVEKNGRSMVALQDLARPLSLRLTRNAELGTVDVNLLSGPETASQATSNSQLYRNAELGLELRVPPGFQLISGPQLRSSTTSSAGKAIGADGQAFQGVEVYFKIYSPSGTLAFNSEPADAGDEDPETLLSRAIQGFSVLLPATQLLGQPTLHTRLGGLDFSQFDARVPYGDSVIRSRNFVRYDPKTCRVWNLSVNTEDELELPKFDPILQSFRW